MRGFFVPIVLVLTLEAILSSGDGKRMQSIDSIKTYTYGSSKDLLSEKEEIKCKNIKRYKKY